MLGSSDEHGPTATTGWPTLTTNDLKAQLDAFQMLHISPILVSAIFSQGKVCRSILQAILHCHPTLRKAVTWSDTLV